MCTRINYDNMIKNSIPYCTNYEWICGSLINAKFFLYLELKIHHVNLYYGGKLTHAVYCTVLDVYDEPKMLLFQIDSFFSLC